MKSYFDTKNRFRYWIKNGQDTLWDSLIYDQSTEAELKENLSVLYALLKTESHVEIVDHLKAERIDYCNFGNSHPFRVKIVNLLNDNYDYMYIKKPDASRVYGLELEASAISQLYQLPGG